MTPAASHPAISVAGQYPVVVAGASTVLIATPDDGSRELPRAEAAKILAGLPPPLLCYAPSIAQRLGTGAFPCLDILELFAFCRPARFCLPTVAGVAQALGLDKPTGLAQQGDALIDAAERLLGELVELDAAEAEEARDIATAMAQGGWLWAPPVLAALGPSATGSEPTQATRQLQAWRFLPEWSETAPSPPPGNQPVPEEDALERLDDLTGSAAEARPQQRDYTRAVTEAFLPAIEEGETHFIVAEAGTGVGKTLGYIAPASLWAERNAGAVWLSTYTRNLQRQIDGELDRLIDDPVEKRRRVVVRKGRENYLCLLNLDDALTRTAANPADLVPLGLVARWARRSRDGDMGGSDFPAWLSPLFGARTTTGLTDRRGECLYSACDHYRKCFIEATIRRARRADLVVANHALVMAQAALGGLDDSNVPTRLIFDEGHNLFDAADSAFSSALSGQEAADLRTWLVGSEDRRRRSGRGLARRIDDIAAIEESIAARLTDVAEAARILPRGGWRQRIESGQPSGPSERFLEGVRTQVYARAAHPDQPYDLETDVRPLVPGLAELAEELAGDLDRLMRAMLALRARLDVYVEAESASLDTPTRQRIEAVSRGLRRRAEGTVAAWCQMLAEIADGGEPLFADWFSVARATGGDYDYGMHRHWVDPMAPFAAAVANTAKGVVVTSATLRDASDSEVDGWDDADARTGARHANGPVTRVSVPSPFDYGTRTRIYLVNDVRRDDPGQVAAAFRELFVAADGGALGLFTAISRLSDVYGRIAAPLEAAGLPLYAQHVDRMDTTTLVDIFRADEQACLLGTDAIRDGVDVPGRSLRLIVFDRVPWPRPTILHKAQREAFGGNRYDDRLARLRLKQAYGRLIRRATDRGVFVMLDPRMPTRLTTGFPAAVDIERVGLAEAIARTREFLAAEEELPQPVRPIRRSTV